MTLFIIIALAIIIIGAVIYFNTAGKNSVSGPTKVSDSKPVQPPGTNPSDPNAPINSGSKPDRSDDKNNPNSDSALSSGGQG